MRMSLLAPVVAMAAAVPLWADRFQFNIHIGEAPYFGYAPHDVVYVERYVPVYDVPRVLIVSRYAGVSPRVIVNRYQSGWRWDRFGRHYQIPRHAFYGPEYQRSYGYFRNHRRHDRERWNDRERRNYRDRWNDRDRRDDRDRRRR